MPPKQWMEGASMVESVKVGSRGTCLVVSLYGLLRIDGAFPSFILSQLSLLSDMAVGQKLYPKWNAGK